MVLEKRCGLADSKSEVMWQYFLVLNKMTPDPLDCRAQPVSKGSKSEDDIMDYMIDRGSTVTKAESKAVLEEFGAAMIYLLKEGYTINTPLFKISPSITGVFTDENDVFDANRHQFNLNINAGDRLAVVPQLIKLKKVEATTALPLPKKLTDVGSGTQNSALTPGGVVKITGKRMKINPEAPEQGVYLVHSKQTFKVASFVTSRPAELVFVLPDKMPAGDYTLEIWGEVNNNMRVGRLEDTLKVA